MTTKTFSFSLQELDRVVEELWQLSETCSIYTFTGPLGAGKTTIIKALCKKAGVDEVVTSPTFTYVNRYRIGHHKMINHFDLYRLQTLDEFLQLGFDEYLYAPNSWCFIEWPELIAPLLTKQVCAITLDYQNENTRRMTYQVVR